MTWFSQGLATASLTPFSTLLFEIAVAVMIIGAIMAALILMIAMWKALSDYTKGIRTVVTDEIDRILINRFRRLGKI